MHFLFGPGLGVGIPLLYLVQQIFLVCNACVHTYACKRVQ